MGKILSKEVQRKILIEIGDLIAENCRACGVSDNPDFCAEQCKVGKQLNEKGLILDGGKRNRQKQNYRLENDARTNAKQSKRTEEEQIAALQVYFDHRKQGLSHKASRIKMKVSNDTVYGWLNKWGHLFEETETFYKKKGEQLQRDQELEIVSKYLEQRRKGISHREAADEIKVDKFKMYTYLRKWGHLFEDTEQYYKYNRVKES